ncbi:hypothetical protein N1851_012343 [Merluccius polli]|uniref:SCAN box domain-containing protein n=1 Tax=Merluccius polli TaxID=89951 RepID=A0AA47P2D4_MERPO|nr:hypothetical protein N1851_012343 [Merluccius polli]
MELKTPFTMYPARWYRTQESVFVKVGGVVRSTSCSTLRPSGLLVMVLVSRKSARWSQLSSVLREPAREDKFVTLAQQIFLDLQYALPGPGPSGPVGSPRVPSGLGRVSNKELFSGRDAYSSLRRGARPSRHMGGARAQGQLPCLPRLYLRVCTMPSRFYQESLTPRGQRARRSSLDWASLGIRDPIAVVITWITMARRSCQIPPPAPTAKVLTGHVKWETPERATGKDIAETMILEQFLRMMDPDLEVWIRECDPKRAASLAEIFMSPWMAESPGEAKNPGTIPDSIVDCSRSRPVANDGSEGKIHGKVCIAVLIKEGYYVGSIIDILAFLAISHLPFRGDHDSLECMAQSGSGLFSSMFEYSLKKAKIALTFPKNATYISHDIQNGIIELINKLVTEHIVEEIGDSFYTIKMNESYIVKERLLTIARSDAGDAKSLTQTLISELRKVGLSMDSALCRDITSQEIVAVKRRCTGPEKFSANLMTTYLRKKEELKEAGVKPSHYSANTTMCTKLVEEECQGLAEDLGFLNKGAPLRPHWPTAGGARLWGKYGLEHFPFSWIWICSPSVFLAAVDVDADEETLSLPASAKSSRLKKAVQFSCHQLFHTHSIIDVRKSEDAEVAFYQPNIFLELGRNACHACRCNHGYMPNHNFLSQSVIWIGILHLVVVHTMSGEGAIEDLFSICNVLYKFTRKLLLPNITGTH